MIVLTKGQSAENIIVTLNEKRTLSTGYYLFVFTNFTTKEVVNVIYSFLADDSSFQTRFNQFEIDTQTIFGNYDVGQWWYDVYEQASSSNTDVAGLNKVECGVMKLNPASEFEFTTYEAATSYEQYQG